MSACSLFLCLENPISHSWSSLDSTCPSETDVTWGPLNSLLWKIYINYMYIYVCTCIYMCMYIYICICVHQHLVLVVKNLPASAGDIRDTGSIQSKNPNQYSCLENPMDREAWWATVYRVTKSRTWLKQLSTIYIQMYMHTYIHIYYIDTHVVCVCVFMCVCISCILRVSFSMVRSRGERICYLFMS